MPPENELNQIFQSIGELVSTTNALHDKINTRQKDQISQYQTIVADLRKVQSSIRTIETTAINYANTVNTKIDRLEERLVKIEEPVKNVMPITENFNKFNRDFDKRLTEIESQFKSIVSITEKVKAFWWVVGILCSTGLTLLLVVSYLFSHYGVEIKN